MIELGDAFFEKARENLAALREQADYATRHVDEVQARRALRKAGELVTAVTLGRASR